MASKDDVIRGYASALFSVAEAEGALGKVEDELFAFAKAVEQSASLRQSLTDAALPAENKKAVVRDLVGDRAHPLTVSLIGFVVEAGRARELPKIVAELASVAAERRQHRLAEVRAAVPLTDAQRDRISAALSTAIGHPVEVKVVLDPSVIGGIVAHVGDQVFDGSIASRLADFRQRQRGN